MEWNAGEQRSKPGMSRAALVEAGRGGCLAPSIPRWPEASLGHLGLHAKTITENLFVRGHREDACLDLGSALLSFQVVRFQTPAVFAWMEERGSLGLGLL